MDIPAFGRKCLLLVSMATAKCMNSFFANGKKENAEVIKIRFAGGYNQFSIKLSFLWPAKTPD